MWNKEISRRKFLKASGIAIASTSVLAGCSMESLTEEKVISPATKKSKNHRAYPYTYTPEKVTKIPTACYMCAVNCAAVGVVDEDGILKRMEPNPNCPVSGGTLCAKGNAGVYQLYDEDRLKTPMRKTGENTWEEITWDEAFDIIHSELTRISNEFGPETVVGLNRRGYDTYLLKGFLKAYGSPNGVLGQESICDGGKRIAQQLVVGASSLYCDFKNSKYIMLFGANQMEAPRYRLAMPADILEAQRNGAKLVVVDPRFNYSAAKADEYLPIKAGTDGLMLMAMNHVIIRDNLYDADFVNTYGAGFEEYKNEVLKDEYSPEAVAEEVGIDAETITRIATEFAQAESAVADTSSGIVTGPNGVQADWHLLNLVALTGNMLAKGGINKKSGGKTKNPSFKEDNTNGRKSFWTTLGYVNYKDHPEGGNRNIITDCVLNPQAVPTGPRVEEDTLPLYDGKGLKALLIYNTDPIGSQADTMRLKEAFSKLEFGFVVDIYLNQTAEALPIGGLALPEATYLERYSARALNAYTPAIAISQPVVEPMYDSKPASWIFTKIGQRFGYAEFMGIDPEAFEKNFDNSILKADQGEGLIADLDQIKSEGVWMKKDIDARSYENYDSVFNNNKYYFAFIGDDITDDHKMFIEASKNPVPTYIRAVEQTEEYPLRFMAGGKVLWHTQTSTRNNKYLMQIFDDGVIVKDTNYIVMSPKDAEARGIENGATARIYSKTGSVEAPVLVTKRVPEGYVHMTHGFGHTAPTMKVANGVGANPNILVDANKIDPYSNTFNIKAEVVNVELV